MKFAIIPWSDKELNDQIFIAKDLKGRVLAQECITGRLRDEFVRQGHQIHTIDYYKDLSEVDYFLFYTLDWKLVKTIIKNGWASKMVYCNAEPPTVTLLNTPKGYKKLTQIFPYILTWNENWIDNKSIFKRNIPYMFYENFGNVEFKERKLLTGISGNKSSDYPDELYSKREEVYSFFEKYYPDDFTFYGAGWNKDKHPCYGGRVLEKSRVFHCYRFAICFENTRNVKGYITEKIFDCLCMGIIPVYAGAEDIADYIPQECYVDYFSFKSDDELAKYLFNMSEEEYQSRLEAIGDFLKTDVKDKFSGEEYARCMLEAVKHQKKFNPTRCGKVLVYGICFKENIISILKRIKRNLIKSE
mgnify:CR=1 FL=1